MKALAVLALLLLATPLLAQESGVPKLEWEFSGDKPENFTLAIKGTEKFDRSSARGAALALMSIQDLMEATDDSELSKLLSAFALDGEYLAAAKLLTPEYIAEMRATRDAESAEQAEREAKERTEGKPARKVLPSRVTGEHAGDDGSVIVEAERVSEHGEKTDGKWEKAVRTQKVRYTAMKAGEAWVISKFERFRRDYRAKAEKYEWAEEETIGFFMLIAQAQPPEEQPICDTPEASARAAVTWLHTATQASGQIAIRKALRVVLDAMRPCFSKEHVAAIEKQVAEETSKAAERRKTDSEAAKKREVTPAKVLEEGVVEITVNPAKDGYEGLRLTMEKHGLVWKIKSASKVRMEGKEEIVTPIKRIYEIGN